LIDMIMKIALLEDDSHFGYVYSQPFGVGLECPSSSHLTKRKHKCSFNY